MTCPITSPGCKCQITMKAIDHWPYSDSKSQHQITCWLALCISRATRGLWVLWNLNRKPTPILEKGLIGGHLVLEARDPIDHPSVCNIDQSFDHRHMPYVTTTDPNGNSTSGGMTSEKKCDLAAEAKARSSFWDALYETLSFAGQDVGNLSTSMCDLIIQNLAHCIRSSWYIWPTAATKGL